MENHQPNSIAITGIGMVGPFGTTLEDLWAACERGPQPFPTAERFDHGLPSSEAHKVDMRQEFGSGQLSRAPLVSQYAMFAVNRALQQAGIVLDRRTKTPDVAIIFGTSNGPGAATQQIYDDLIDQGPAGVKPRVFQESVFNAPASLASIHYGITGAIQVVPASGNSGAAVLYQAQLLLAQPNITRVIAICSEELCDALQVGLHDLKWHAGYNAEGSLTSGAVMAEGAAALVLEPAFVAKERDAKILAEITGVGFGNDAAAVGKPDMTGGGMIAAIDSCLDDAQITPADVHKIVPGASGTNVDFELETNAIEKVFSSAEKRVAPAKTVLGCAMGSSLFFEIALAAQAFAERRFPTEFTKNKDEVTPQNVLCNAIGLNGQFGSVLVREAL
ncbi:beta-ketoacyl synthase N-terminal-like domain-containing protein [Pseudovibrio ascidiaceicola]|jgi:3-oxoacyl-(acyl-carrier-protein) synthase|uniref:beta-ketoacyl synthase N-terminal-like domain-containing protein n=1 Tax=Pseudovibrio ascidiaceicola TaxID=285279 RepID=UPI000D69B96C|nr:beta-ketoacyl synthase N-terminal-like domain-containing protein [Pseudovibrio ascidiaceicola]